MTNLRDQAHDLRQGISIAMVQVNQLDKTRETATAYTRLEEAFMFLGKALGYLGEENPNPKDSEKGKMAIKITDSVNPNEIQMPSGKPVDQVKAIRMFIQEIISAKAWNELLNNFTMPGQPFVRSNDKGWMITNYALVSVMAGKMWLGMQINNIASSSYREEVKELPKDLKDKPATPNESFQIHKDNNVMKVDGDIEVTGKTVVKNPEGGYNINSTAIIGKSKSLKGVDKKNSKTSSKKS